jgi:hypothetical protein
MEMLLPGAKQMRNGKKNDFCGVLRSKSSERKGVEQISQKTVISERRIDSRENLQQR